MTYDFIVSSKATGKVRECRYRVSLSLCRTYTTPDTGQILTTLDNLGALLAHNVLVPRLGDKYPRELLDSGLYK